MAKIVNNEVLSEDKLNEAYEKLQLDPKKSSVMIDGTHFRLARITDPIQKIKPAKNEHRRYKTDYAVIKTVKTVT